MVWYLQFVVMKIRKLTLFSAQIEKQAHFYSKVLSLPKIGQKKDSVSFMVGDSVLKFCYRPEIKPYHFAFNISSNKAQDAMKWLTNRVELLSYEGKKIVNFHSWDAEAIYFYDSDSNYCRIHCPTSTQPKQLFREFFSI